MRFEFATAGRIIFGPGALDQLGPIAAQMGQRAFVVTGRELARAQPLLDALTAQGIACSTFQVSGEPTIETILSGIEQARSCCLPSGSGTLVIGFGGGSVLDAGKAMAALLTNPGDPLDYLEVVGRGRPLTCPPLPYIAIPTTAGTGAEVTRNAVLSVPTHCVKVSLRSPLMLPRLALVDPELTYSLPPAVTASTGMDALAQLIEPFVSKRANPFVDALCREGMARVARSLRRAYEHGDDIVARQDMALASLLSGLALANAGLGAVHGLAAPIGGMFPAPHGAICACLLPHVMAVNVRALCEREPDNPALLRYNEIARSVTGNPAAQAADGMAWVHELGAALHIPSLAVFGLTPADFPALIEKAAVASSMQANPISLTSDEMDEILRRAL